MEILIMSFSILITLMVIAVIGFIVMSIFKKMKWGMYSDDFKPYKLERSLQKNFLIPQKLSTTVLVMLMVWIFIVLFGFPFMDSKVIDLLLRGYMISFPFAVVFILMRYHKDWQKETRYTVLNRISIIFEFLGYIGIVIGSFMWIKRVLQVYFFDPMTAWKKIDIVIADAFYFGYVFNAGLLLFLIGKLFQLLMDIEENTRK
ncbi:MAG: hypothetical protein QF864_02125 [SAR202 cluster bacterium]|nr:hypothetical protein [SAR202 cluster bacterium]